MFTFFLRHLLEGDQRFCALFQGSADKRRSSANRWRNFYDTKSAKRQAIHLTLYYVSASCPSSGVAGCASSTRGFLLAFKTKAELVIQQTLVSVFDFGVVAPLGLHLLSQSPRHSDIFVGLEGRCQIPCDAGGGQSFHVIADKCLDNKTSLYIYLRNLTFRCR